MLPVEADRIARPARWRGSAWQVGVRVVSIGLQGAAFALIARLLGPGAFGGFAGAFALASLFGAASEFGLQNTTVVELSPDGVDASAVLARAMLASVFLGAAGLLFAAPVAAFAFHGTAAVSFAALVPWTVLSRLSTPGAAWWQARLDFRRLFVAEVVGRGSAAAGLGMLLLVRPDWDTRKLIIVAGSMLATGAVLQFLAVLPVASARSGIRTADLVAGTRRLVTIAAPLGIVSAISLIHVRSDQILLELMGHGGRELGDYAVAYRVIEGIAGVLGALATVGFSILSRTEESDRARVNRSNAAIVSAVGLAGGLAVLGAAPVFVAVVGGRGFGGAVWPCRLLAVVVTISVLNMVPSLTVVAQRQARRLLPIGLGLVAANIALNIVLIPQLGATGSAVATIATEMAGLALVTRVAHQVLPGSQRPVEFATAVLACGLAFIGFGLDSLAMTVVGFAAATVALVAMVISLSRSMASAIPGER